jgi:hypothetical protein
MAPCTSFTASVAESKGPMARFLTSTLDPEAERTGSTRGGCGSLPSSTHHVIQSCKQLDQVEDALKALEAGGIVRPSGADHDYLLYLRA